MHVTKKEAFRYYLRTPPIARVSPPTQHSTATHDTRRDTHGRKRPNRERVASAVSCRYLMRTLLLPLHLIKQAINSRAKQQAHRPG
mmetsp:Transcript_51244/g.128703  ORF Transcript_51244/g.128703 Transcript_51244/m.128703 type:complete len:86 (-) Transcript_51244:263-520(-)